MKKKLAMCLAATAALAAGLTFTRSARADQLDAGHEHHGLHDPSYDADRDGRLDRSELERRGDHGRYDRRWDRHYYDGERYRGRDWDRDYDYRHRRYRRYGAFDLDRDGRVERWERSVQREARRELRRWDRDRDGYISWREAPGARYADIDRDGFVSYGELVAYLARSGDMNDRGRWYERRYRD